ncbi:hypothetical protein J2045_000280 [Peteryoungia aggregata LMG 23059]|uniref:Uncharacterized protein n=1 Tax=Peteryoungia aggregata LMG 23059 TaxID=1368425 RepID=A0ABU0G1R5_9HYPH|nr:hypothetical protein [Peteryoungia aggregata]MDQ0419270.1 hypothetical protein [Peteryoungia aggregata LMG 23059]
MQANIEHRYNTMAAEVVARSARIVTPVIPKALADWLVEARFYNGYFLGPRNPPTSIDRQIAEATTYLDAFSVEMLLNKLHLQDDLDDNYPAHDVVLIYLAVCDYFARYLVMNRITSPMLLWYSTDAFDPDAEFPSHTMSFGFPRSMSDYYPLDISEGSQVRIVTKITLAV